MGAILLPFLCQEYFLLTNKLICDMYIHAYFGNIWGSNRRSEAFSRETLYSAIGRKDEIGEVNVFFLEGQILRL